MIRMLAKSRLEAAEIATKKGIPEALTILLRDFTKEPRKLSSDDMQWPLTFLVPLIRQLSFLLLATNMGWRNIEIDGLRGKQELTYFKYKGVIVLLYYYI